MNRSPLPIQKWHPPMLTTFQKQETAFALRHDDHLTYDRIGARMGYSRERVRILVGQAMRRRQGRGVR